MVNNESSKQHIVLRENGYRLDIQSMKKGVSKLIIVSELENEPDIPESLLSCETSYDLELIETIFKQKKRWTCDEIRRDEDPLYVERLLYHTILCHIPKEEFDGKYILDFGCGAGASTVILKRLFPESKILGVDMDADLLVLARERVRFYGFKDIEFACSSNPLSIPTKGIQFDHIILNAVYEHLLKDEREVLFPLLWKLMKIGGIIFINETPNRWYKNEMHTTHLNYINYMPDFLAYWIVRKKWSQYRGENWHRLLKDGIRGGSMKELKRIFRRNRCSISFPEPDRLGVKNRLDLFYHAYDLEQYIGNKDYNRNRKLLKHTGIVNTSALILAIRKEIT